MRYYRAQDFKGLVSYFYTKNAGHRTQDTGTNTAADNATEGTGTMKTEVHVV